MFFSEYQLEYLVGAIFFIIIVFALDVEFHCGMHLFILVVGVHGVLTDIDVQAFLFFEILAYLEISLLYDEFCWKRPFLNLWRKLSFLLGCWSWGLWLAFLFKLLLLLGIGSLIGCGTRSFLSFVSCLIYFLNLHSNMLLLNFLFYHNWNLNNTLSFRIFEHLSLSKDIWHSFSILQSDIIIYFLFAIWPIIMWNSWSKYMILTIRRHLCFVDCFRSIHVIRLLVSVCRRVPVWSSIITCLTANVQRSFLLDLKVPLNIWCFAASFTF